MLTCAGACVTVYDASDVRHRAPRDAALERIADDLAKMGAGRLVLERDDSVHDSDRRVIRERCQVPDCLGLLVYEHMKAHEEPLLGIPDAVALPVATALGYREHDRDRESRAKVSERDSESWHPRAHRRAGDSLDLGLNQRAMRQERVSSGTYAGRVTSTRKCGASGTRTRQRRQSRCCPTPRTRRRQDHDQVRPIRVPNRVRGPERQHRPGASLQVSGGCGIRTHDEAHAP